jgi:hypothetical protein
VLVVAATVVQMVFLRKVVERVFRTVRSWKECNRYYFFSCSAP